MQTTEITLEQAKEVLAAHHEAARVARIAENQQYVGKFYRYRNSYGVGGDSKSWWLYAAIIGVDEGGTLLGWTFQQTSEGNISIEPTGTVYPWSGYEEIPASVFQRAALKVLSVAVGRLSPASDGM